MEDNNSVKTFYGNAKEDDRLGRETLEYTRTKSIVSRYLCCNSMEIADVGGATGAYSFWLAKIGHQVHLLDLAENHIEIAKQRSVEKGIKLASYSCADARSLPYENESMDMVLLMGALYHFQAIESRMKCLTEAFRVLRKDGVLLCTVMNRYNYLISSLKYSHLREKIGLDSIKHALSTGVYDNTAYTSMPLLYGYTPREIFLEMKESGFDDITQIAVEGIANALGDNTLPLDENEAEKLIKCIELVESVPELLGVSRNIITVGKKVKICN